eukprot:3585012-Rhodomonas_salina.1
MQTGQMTAPGYPGTPGTEFSCIKPVVALAVRGCIIIPVPQVDLRGVKPRNQLFPGSIGN